MQLYTARFTTLIYATRMLLLYVDGLFTEVYRGMGLHCISDGILHSVNHQLQRTLRRWSCCELDLIPAMKGFIPLRWIQALSSLLYITTQPVRSLILPPRFAARNPNHSTPFVKPPTRKDISLYLTLLDRTIIISIHNALPPNPPLPPRLLHPHHRRHRHP